MKLRKQQYVFKGCGEDIILGILIKKQPLY